MMSYPHAPFSFHRHPLVAHFMMYGQLQNWQRNKTLLQAGMNSNESFLWVVGTKPERGEIIFVHLFSPFDICFDFRSKILSVEFVEYLFQVYLVIVNKAESWCVFVFRFWPNNPPVSVTWTILLTSFFKYKYSFCNWWTCSLSSVVNNFSYSYLYLAFLNVKDKRSNPRL